MMMLSSTPVPGAVVPEGCFAVYEAGVVAVGNRRFERRWLVLPEGLSPLSVRLDGRELLVPADIAAGISDARWETFAAPLTCTGAPALHARLELGTARYHFAVTAGAAAITVERESELAAAAVAEAAGPTGLEIDPAPEAERSAAFECCENLEAASPHLRLLEFRFADQTDRHDNLLDIREYRLGPVEPLRLRGVLWAVESPLSGEGIALLKLAPLPESRPIADPVDFEWDCRSLRLHGDRYPWAAIGYSGGRCGLTRALQEFQRELRPPRCGRDGIAISNTWGDRNRDQALNEKFMLRELEIAAGIGLDACQIDDGWQVGKSPNSAVAKGSFKNIWDNPDYWKPDPEKYPRGLHPVVELGRELGVEICLWFNPSVQDGYADWEKDAQALVGLYDEYGIRTFKIDGLAIPDKRSESNLRRLFDRVLERTGGQVVFNLDATAGRRGGYHMFNEYGNIFLENRYTDWQNYYPYWTLRNLWMLSKYVPAEKLQIEFLNKWRNTEKYAGDPFAPANYSFEYLFATTMAGQPLAWMEASGLPEEALGIGALIERYKEVQHDFHRGVILPVGDEPSGRSWTGFQSVDGERGYLIFFREQNPDRKARIETWLPENSKVRLTPVLGSGKAAVQKTGRRGTLEVELPAPNDYTMYRYELIR